MLPCGIHRWIKNLPGTGRAGALLAAALLLMFAVGCATTPEPRVRSAKADSRLAGDRVLVLFMPDDWPPRMIEEDLAVYTAWAGLIEEFVRRSEHLREVRKADFRRGDEFFRSPGLPVNEYTILLVRNGTDALFANEPVFDGAIYDYADAFLGGVEDDFFWPQILRPGQFETSMPRVFKRVKLRPGELAAAARPAQRPLERSERPSDPAQARTTETPADAVDEQPAAPEPAPEITTQPAGEGAPGVLPPLPPPRPPVPAPRPPDLLPPAPAPPATLPETPPPSGN